MFTFLNFWSKNFDNTNGDSKFQNENCKMYLFKNNYLLFKILEIKKNLKIILKIFQIL